MFGDSYVQFRQKTPIGIPLMGYAVDAALRKYVFKLLKISLLRKMGPGRVSPLELKVPLATHILCE